MKRLHSETRARRLARYEAIAQKGPAHARVEVREGQAMVLHHYQDSPSRPQNQRGVEYIGTDPQAQHVALDRLRAWLRRAEALR